MPRICYVERNFRPKTLERIEQANEIIEEYQSQGYSLTLRQLYYQFVARDLIPNKDAEYNNLGSIINDARLAGLIDWVSIEDRTRNLKSLAHWESPADILKEDAECFRIDRWARQPYRVEVWIEKEALAGVFERVCESLDVPYFSCRGYVSQSEQWRAARRLRGYEVAGQSTLILHFGDHDPSGIDMSRDIQDRLALFGSKAAVKRIALNMDQVEAYGPPPNPAKLTDSRATDYIERFGKSSWELDALEPSVLAQLVRDEVGSVQDEDAWQSCEEEEDYGQQMLQSAADNWDQVVEFMQEDEGSG